MNGLPFALGLAGALAAAGAAQRGSAARQRGVTIESGGDSLLWRKVGINQDPDETDYEVARDAKGKVLAASTFGFKTREEGDAASFSVGVLPEARRRGLARTLVQRILRAHPGTDFDVWVVNPHMAELLMSLGFSTESSRGWSPDAPHMTFRTPTRREVTAKNKAKALREAQLRDAAARRPAEAAAQAAKRAATVREVAAKTPAELHALDFLYVDPDRFVRDPAFAREVHRLLRAGHYPSFIPRLPDSYLPLDDEGRIDERKLTRLRASFAFIA